VSTAPEEIDGVSRSHPGAALRPWASPSVWLIGLFGLALACALALRSLIPAHMDPTVFLALGEDKPIQTSYARGLLGDVSVRPSAGHDGKFFFAQANDPFYLEPEVHAAVLDDPVYRGQRMLYPTIAGGFGLFPPAVVVWGMVVTNVLALAIGSLLAGRLARSLGGSSWLGLSVALNIGLIYELEIDGAGVVAYVCCLASLVALAKDETSLAAVWLAAAALGREVMLAFALGVFLLRWRTERKVDLRLLAVPLVVSAAWSAYLRLRLSGVSGVGGAPANFSPPFRGFLEALQVWAKDPVDLVINLTLVVLVLTFTMLAIHSRLPIVWGALPFVALSIVLSVNVWAEPFDFSRILAPVFTAAPFLLLARSRDTVGAGGIDSTLESS
jgi:hypothetical protein